MSLPALRVTQRHAAWGPYIPLLQPQLYQPSVQRPIRAKMRQLNKHTSILPHTHAWGQLAISTGGVIRVSLPDATYIVPPHCAVWVPADVQHAITLVETANLYTLYFLPPSAGGGAQMQWMQSGTWKSCRVLAASPLLRAMVVAMDVRSDGDAAFGDQHCMREQHLSALICDEIQNAPVMHLGVRLPQDKRLRHLCQAVLDAPGQHTTLQAWVQDTGASLRTVARLFHTELGCTFTQWRQQVVLSHAVALAAKQRPIAHIAAELGYTPSAFSALVRRNLGMTASSFLGQHQNAASLRTT